ncbi:hypothetical protein BKA24_001728 [Microbacterium marinum]|uniref:Uncharacterized protein n=1 Tax=Microbacterium marinum TaxID=421115 RepID=A0A7W7BQL0_9MICO|nr:hypothetical protein [Microbacterium marinum]MBB4667019.1 hypothetical protein [Microbacterium marinum]
MADISTLLEKYKNAFDLDGKLRVAPGVTEKKVKRVQGLYEAALAGDRIAEATLSELFASSDAPFAMSHLINLQTIPQLPEEEEKTIGGLVAERKVRDFNPVTLFSLISGKGVEGVGVDDQGAAAIVPEGGRYPLVSVKSDLESFYQKLSKRGFRFDYTWESRVNDTVGFFEALPDELLRTTVDTQYAEIFDALDMAKTALGAFTLPDGTVVPSNALPSPEAIIAADMQIGLRQINGRKIGEISRYNVFVPIGGKKPLEWKIERYFATIDITNPSTGVRITPPPMRSLFPNITIVETERLTGTSWKMVPAPGTTKGRPVWEILKLRGYELPELRVRSDAGFHLGGGKVDQFEGGFENDSLSFRYRYVVGGVLWDEKWVGVSNGTGGNPVAP